MESCNMCKVEVKNMIFHNMTLMHRNNLKRIEEGKVKILSGTDFEELTEELLKK